MNQLGTQTGSSKSVRAFMGIPLDGRTQHTLNRGLTRFKAADELAPKSRETIRWVNAENRHITLAFLDNVNLKQVAELQQALAEALADLRCFDTELTGIGGFPDAKGAIIGAYLNSTPAFEELYRRLFEVCGELGLRQEGRKFRPHITLGRVKTPGRRYTRRRPHPSPFIRLRGRFKVTCVQVYQSRLTPKGSEYAVLFRQPLQD